MNPRPNPPKLASKASHQKGTATIIVVIVLTAVISTITLYSAESVQNSQRVTANTLREKQAFEAAESGLEYGISHIKENGTSIMVDSDLDGYIDPYSNSDTTNVNQANGTQYSFSYANPTLNDFDVITLSSTGVCDDGSVQRTIVQDLLKLTHLVNSPPAGFIARGNVTMSGNMSITNTETGHTIWAGGNVALQGSASTTGSPTTQGISTGSDKHAINSDITMNDASLSSLSNDEFFQNFFGMSKSQARDSANILYSDDSNVNYSDLLNGVVGKTIWLDHSAGGEASFSGNAVIGSPSQPVVLIVDGNFKANGTTVIYGAIYVAQDWNNSGGGTLDIYGAIIVEGAFSGTGTPNVEFSENVLNATNSIADYVKIPGSWRDF